MRTVFTRVFAVHRNLLQQRAGGAAIQIETGRNKEDRRSTKTSDWFKAVEKAELSNGDVEAVKHMEEAHTHRYGILMARSDLRDPETSGALEAPVNRIPARDGGARLRCFVALCFHHGHRPIHVASLSCGNIAFATEETKALLRTAPNHRTWWAEYFPHGGVLWESSKKEYIRFTPFSRMMRKEMDRWRELHPDWRPDAPLFPMRSDPNRSTSADRFREWTSKAIEIARSDLMRANVPSAQVERWLAGETVYGFRGHWATIMDRLGYGWTAARDGQSKLDLHKHVAFLGDWKIGGDTMERVYAKLHPGILQAILEFERAKDVIDRFSRET